MMAAEMFPQMADKHLRAKNSPPRNSTTLPQHTNSPIKFAARNRITAPSAFRAREAAAEEAAVHSRQSMPWAAEKADTSRQVRKIRIFFMPEARARYSADTIAAQEWNETSKSIRDFSLAKPPLLFPIDGSGRFQSCFHLSTRTLSTLRRNFFTKQLTTVKAGRKLVAI